MKKRIICMLLVAIMALSMLTGCGNGGNTGKVVNIYVWNEEFKGFFEKYYTATVPYLDTDGDGKADAYYDKAPGKKYLDQGYKFKFIINASDGGLYQEKLDAALSKSAKKSTAKDSKVDLFLAEADYIQKYVDSNVSQDITGIGFSDFSQMYGYTIDACKDQSGVVKGVSFQCCPSALIYRRSIAEDVLGTSDPAEVQAALNTWDKFDAAAATAKDKGYYMMASFAEAFRVYSNNCTSAWVDKDNKLVFDDAINAWLDQTKKYCDNEYTLLAGVWDDEKNQQMFASGKTMCFFGPAWYFNFCMGNAHDAEAGCMGDWAIVEGPQAHFWGGTWILASAYTDNAEIVCDIMNAFTNDQDVVNMLVEVESQYPNNKKVVDKYANDASYGSEFLGGQNDIAVFSQMTDNIKWENHTVYDQLLNEGLQTYIKTYLDGTSDLDTALANFYNYVNEKYPEIVTP